MTAMEGGKTNEKTKKTDLHGTALHLLPVFYGFCAGIGGRNGGGGGTTFSTLPSLILPSFLILSLSICISLSSIIVSFILF